MAARKPARAPAGRTSKTRSSRSTTRSSNRRSRTGFLQKITPEVVRSVVGTALMAVGAITLIALLTTVAHTWRQEALADNYREVARLGREFYERLAIFADRFDEVRKKLDGAVQAYNEAAGSFEGRVLVSARRLRELDVTTAEELPPAQPIDKVPRVLKQIGLLGLPDNAEVEEAESP